MTLNQKAAIITVAVIASMIGGAVGASYLLSLLGPAAPGIAGGLLISGVLVYLTFGIVKNRLEYDQKLQELNQK